MIGISAISNRQRHVVVFGDEPHRTDVILDPSATVFVYEGVTAEDGTPQWEPAVIFDGDIAEEDGGNYSLVSFKQAEITELRGRGQTVQEIAEVLANKGLNPEAAESIAQTIQQVGNDEEHWNRDCQRFVYSYTGFL